MKIYSKVVMDMTGDVLEAEFEEYMGPVAELKGKGGSEPPPPAAPKPKPKPEKKPEIEPSLKKKGRYGTVLTKHGGLGEADTSKRSLLGG